MGHYFLFECLTRPPCGTEIKRTPPNVKKMSCYVGVVGLLEASLLVILNGRMSKEKGHNTKVLFFRP